ncbi:hypothetical protein PJL18_04326 [Paenarthrobacter nicotinovorans]|nr:hypothetical protein [Paenarthrobacter nicotinovorans]
MPRRLPRWLRKCPRVDSLRGAAALKLRFGLILLRCVFCNAGCKPAGDMSNMVADRESRPLRSARTYGRTSAFSCMCRRNHGHAYPCPSRPPAPGNGAALRDRRRRIQRRHGPGSHGTGHPLGQPGGPRRLRHAYPPRSPEPRSGRLRRRSRLPASHRPLREGPGPGFRPRRRQLSPLLPARIRGIGHGTGHARQSRGVLPAGKSCPDPLERNHRRPLPRVLVPPRSDPHRTPERPDHQLRRQLARSLVGRPGPFRPAAAGEPRRRRACRKRRSRARLRNH